MRRRIASFACVLALAAASASCTTGEKPPPGTGADGSTPGCMPGALTCLGNQVQRCEVGGGLTPIEDCVAPLVCGTGVGCVTCNPGAKRCTSDTMGVEECAADGSGWSIVEQCVLDEVCSSGAPHCVNGCEDAIATRSTMGCEYWAVDLDNEYSGIGDAASEPFAVALANPSNVTVRAFVYENLALPGAAVSQSVVFEGNVEPQGVLEIRLPKREVDCSTDAGHNDGSGTCVSSRAYRIETNFPVVAYQFNPIVLAYSNDASLLVPTTGLDVDYRVLSYPSRGGLEPMPGQPPNPLFTPMRGYVTVVGTQPDTHVTVTLTGPTLAGSGIPAQVAGGVVEYVLGPHDVLNLESYHADLGADGDLTGTVVHSDKPVAVFAGTEGTSIGQGAPMHPGNIEMKQCCTDHLEEQVFPLSSWGQDFVLTHSPQRGAGWVEPDIIRVMADRETTTVTTNLPGSGSFVLAPGEWTQLYVQQSFVMSADHPIAVAQILVSQEWVHDYQPGRGGDPSLSQFPPYQQYRDNYVFLTPSTFATNFVVFSAPEGTAVELDGADVNREFGPCVVDPAGPMGGMMYNAVVCPVEPGVHRVRATMPIGLVVYGYHGVGSYAYVGGSDLERINIPF